MTAFAKRNYWNKSAVDEYQIASDAATTTIAARVL
jgi:hypothetical protein